eukprot:CAMPEP_0117418296 /NCGR_PEP_ID=MMETSP0758-20121206/105_1 /TAXON_ID=63605 /ORGANISM="Percolomonas cosmopolitus, Strain AE-1 (ATCC 50343)" /LENGTH=319 /DNA_ID=CAMNT_0005198713 /DNA_START=891 /DNA_END=1847 /DNA_ORIENTATION=-
MIKPHWRVQFTENPETIDLYGVRREYVTLLCKALFLDSNLWVEQENYYLIPSASASDSNSLMLFEFTGRFLAKCFFENMFIDANFCPFVLKFLLGKRVTYHDMKFVDEIMYKNQILWVRDNDITDILYMTFCVSNEAGENVDLVENGRSKVVTNENKIDYLNAFVNYKLKHSIEPQLRALMKGFHDIIPLHMLSSFDTQEFSELLCGKTFHSVDDWKSNTDFKGGYSLSSKTIGYLFEYLRTSTKEKQLALLQFVTGSRRIPHDGFRSLKPLFTIQRLVNRELLPSASVCFNLLKLPEYQSYATLSQKLDLVLTEGIEG